MSPSSSSSSSSLQESSPPYLEARAEEEEHIQLATTNKCFFSFQGPGRRGGGRRKGSMGQMVSYILRCISGEAVEEEKSDDEQNLLSNPLNSNSCSKSWIDSSSANNVAKHQCMFNPLDIQVSHEKAQRRRSCIDLTNIDQVLQPDNLLVAPPNLVPSIDPSTTGGTLLHEVFDDTFTDVPIPSINTSNDQALVHELFIDSSTDVPCMDISNDQALVHEPFIDPSSTDVPSINTSNDQALVHELFIDPSSTDVPCMDMSNDQALVHEPFIDPSSTDVPSINTSNDQALVHELSVDPSIDVPCIDSSINEAFLPKLEYTRAGFRIFHQFKVTDLNTQVVEDKSQVHSPNTSSKTKKWWKRKEAKARKEAADFTSIDSSTDEALQHELFIDPSTDVPCMDMSNDQALVHELFIDPSSTDVPSINTSNDQALVNELSVDPSINVPSIDSSTNEATDLNTQVVEDKSQAHSPKKRTKRKGAKARKEAAVVIERKIKHYSSLQKILLVGEGDFSFSACLARSFGSASNIVATSLDSTGVVTGMYKEAKSNLENLEKLGASLLDRVDATKMELHPDLQMWKFDRIIFNFPHAGFLGKEDNVLVIGKHRDLVHGFFRNAKSMLRPNGEIHVNHKTTAPFCDWNLEEIASRNSLVLIQRVDFKRKDYPGYNQKRGAGSRCDDPFPLGECSTFKFIFSPTAAKARLISFHGCQPQQESPIRMQQYQMEQQFTSLDFRYLQPNFIANMSGNVQENVNLPFSTSIQNDCSRIFDGYFSHANTTFGRTDYDVGYSVCEALNHGFERYMAEPGRTLNDYIHILHELHRLSTLRSAWLKRMLCDLDR